MGFRFRGVEWGADDGVYYLCGHDQFENQGSGVTGVPTINNIYILISGVAGTRHQAPVHVSLKSISPPSPAITAGHCLAALPQGQLVCKLVNCE